MGYMRRSADGTGIGGGYYPMGDPGLLGFIKGIIKPVWKAVKPIAGALIGGALGATVVVGPGGGGGPGTAVVTTPPGGGIMPGGAGTSLMPTVGITLGGARGAAPMGGLCPSGYHPAKDGSGRCVRNRRMNIANPRALRRSMRRVQGFEKLARKTISFTKRVRMKKRRSG